MPVKEYKSATKSFASHPASKSQWGRILVDMNSTSKQQVESSRQAFVLTTFACHMEMTLKTINATDKSVSISCTAYCTPVMEMGLAKGNATSCCQVPKFSLTATRRRCQQAQNNQRHHRSSVRGVPPCGILYMYCIPHSHKEPPSWSRGKQRRE